MQKVIETIKGSINVEELIDNLRASTDDALSTVYLRINGEQCQVTLEVIEETLSDGSLVHDVNIKAGCC